MAVIRPFPFRALESIRREDVARLHALLGAVARVVDLAVVGAAAAEVLGARVGVRLRQVGVSGAVVAPSVSILVASSVGGSPVRLVAESGLVAAVLAAGLRQRSARMLDPSRGAGEASAGAFAAVIVAVGRRAGVPLTVLAAGVAPEKNSDFDSKNSVGAAFTVRIDDDVFLAQVTTLASSMPAAVPLDLRALSSLGEVRLALGVVAGCSRATVADVASLREGDVWMGGCASLRKGGGGWTGEVALASARSERGLTASLVDGDQIVLRDGGSELAWAPPSEDEMIDETALLESVGEVPVVVRVEIGTAEMSAREWAQLCVGQVVALGRRVGESVVLRVGGVELARGELVDIEGEVGVRILQRTGRGS